MKTCTTLDRGPAYRMLKRVGDRDSWHRKIRLCTSDCETHPIAFGLLRPTVLLPCGIESRLSKDELRGLISHEVAHLRRGDVLWLWVGRLLCRCAFYQPLNFVAKRRWQSASEYLCDQWAVRQGVSPLALARCLTAVASWQLQKRASAMTLSAAGSKSTIIGRVEQLTRSGFAGRGWRASQHCAFLSLAATVSFVVATLAPSIGWRATAASPILSSAHAAPSDPLQPVRNELDALDLEIDRAVSMLQSNSDPQIQQATQLLIQRHEQLRRRYESLSVVSTKEVER